MESADAPTRDALPLDAALLAAAARNGASAVEDVDDPAEAIDAAIGAFSDVLPDAHPSVFVLEHARLWLVAERGYAVVPDGIRIQKGIMGRAVRLGRAQLVLDVWADDEYVPALPGVRSELAVPLRRGRLAVGVLNVESERRLPSDAARLIRPLVAAMAPRVEVLRGARTLDPAALARLFVHLGSLRDAGEIAALSAVALARMLPIEASQLVLWDEAGRVRELGAWSADGARATPLVPAELETAHALANPMLVSQLLDRDRLELEPAEGEGGGGLAVWLPLRTNGKELGALVGTCETTSDPDQKALDTAAVLAAHVAATLDAAVVIERERQSAVTDSLTGILNRRGFEEHLEGELVAAQERRMPVSLLVMDCDDFKEINDRAGHEFGDTLLVEVAKVLRQSIPAGASAARLGGDEFVVVLPGAGIDAAQDVGAMIRRRLSDGLTAAGFPLRISAGIATYPFDGANAATLLRASDQAMYAAKNIGKDCVASFRDVRAPEALLASSKAQVRPDERRGGIRSDGSILAEAIGAAGALEAETTADGVCNRLCKSLVFLVGATACSASRIEGEYLVDASAHALRDISVGQGVRCRISDFPVTAEVLRSGEARALSFLDGDVDHAEAFVLRELKMNAVLMLPLHVRGQAWGLVELYEMRLRRFTDDDVALARFLVTYAERRLEHVATTVALDQPGRVYPLPTRRSPRPGPRTR